MFVNTFQPMDRHSTLWVNQAIAENHRINAQIPKQYPGFTYFEPIKFQTPIVQFSGTNWGFSPFAGFNWNSGSTLWGGLFNNSFLGTNQSTGNFFNFGSMPLGNLQQSNSLWGGLLNYSWNSTASLGFPTFSSNKSKSTNKPAVVPTSDSKTTPTVTTKPATKPTKTQNTKPAAPKTAASYNRPAINTSAKRDFRQDFVKTAKKYMGYNEADGSSRRISRSGEWCADFIKYVLDETYASKGLKTPSGLHKEWDMPHLRVENIKNWGIKKGMYLDIAHQSNRAKTITDNVKVGDILILRENRASHTGFVTKIYPDGSFDTIEGNRNDKVSTGHYSANHRDISGFVQVT